MLKEPFLHFLLLGGVLFVLNAWREGKRTKEAETTGIEVTAGVIERLRALHE